MTQVQVRQGRLMQTLAAQPTGTGVWLLSTLAFPGGTTSQLLEEEAAEIYIPNEAAAWLAGIAAALTASARAAALDKAAADG